VIDELPTDTAQGFDRVASLLDYPMIVVTTVAGPVVGGCLVGFHTQSSINPPRYAVWLSKANHTFRVALQADVFALHFLDEANKDLAEIFGTTTNDQVDKFDGCRWHPGPEGVPLLDGCATRSVMQKCGLVDDGGDHVCVVLEPVTCEVSGPYDPLMFSHVRDLDAGHDPNEA
jgi:flavin reductase (DIM6/NTAB) family NADH-FMN oxidoreductase RutF